MIPARLATRLKQWGFNQVDHSKTGYMFTSTDQKTCLILDTSICTLQDYQYVEYTSTQNRLMAQYDQVFRYLLDSSTSPELLAEEIEMFLLGESDPEKIRRFGANRQEVEPDPTMPEAVFEDCFLEAFGEQSRMSLHREFCYADLAGTTRHIDYALFGKNQKYAIELNGEKFHHPAVIGPKKYRSQLFKQNSLIADGFKVYRWSLKGMRDRERFVLELTRFMEGAQPFQNKAILRATRAVFTLQEHQLQSLENLSRAREEGRKTFLLVLPTGTGKTEIFIEDIIQLHKHTPTLRALILVPTRNLRKQTIARLRLRLPATLQNSISEDVLGETKANIYVQTSAYLHRHYYKLTPDSFDYIVLDEAHHGVAQGLRNIVEHFTPEHLLGVTATPDRLDQKKLEEIFGEYTPQLSLEDAVRKGIVPPVRCYRIKSNIDLSEVRFNGREYVKSDLQKTLLVPSRDQLIADILNKYFSGEFEKKQGVVFCVDIKHAQSMAKLLFASGIAAEAVDGKNRTKADEAQQRYNSGATRFLCACDLLTEGWDAPQTSILVMARPTFSKVLYTQQLGRGLRNHPGKEALYVIDVVDNYGAKLQPMSLHALLRIPSYQPFENLIEPNQKGTSDEIIILDGLHEEVRRVEPVDIFTFNELYGDFLNEEQLARELFISTGTVKQWVNSGKITPDVSYPFGRRKLYFFSPQQVEQIREENGLKGHGDDTRLADFEEFLEKRDYTFSYKIIFLLSFFKICNERSEALLPDLLSLYRDFYLKLLARAGKNEKDNCPYNQKEYLDDPQAIQRSILDNPFEKFERKRFFYHCKDLNYIALDPVLATGLTEKHYEKISQQIIQDLHNYYEKFSISLTEEDFSFLLKDKDDVFPQSLFVDNPMEKQKFYELLPFYPLKIAAGAFQDSNTPLIPETWFKVDGLTSRRNLSTSMFVAQVRGHSMEPVIPHGSFCLFTFEVGGTRNGRIVLAQKADISDQDTGASFTIKRYRSKKVETSDDSWEHESITLLPENPEYQEINIPADEAEDFRIIAFFVEVLTDGKSISEF